VPQGTARQIEEWALHKEICQNLGITQSTLKHKSLAGSVGAPSPTGVTVYTPPDPTPSVRATTDTPVWCVWQELTSRSPMDSTMAGRLGVPMLKGQLPAVDDNGNVLTIAHDDWIQDGNNVLYRILNPVISTDLGYWSFEVLRQR